MCINQNKASTLKELLTLLSDKTILSIMITDNINMAPTIKLLPGMKLIGKNSDTTIHFVSGSDGIQLSTDNQIENLQLVADLDKRAVFNDTTVNNLGHLLLKDLKITGVVQLLARDKVEGGHVEAHNVDIISADARGYEDRPKGYGVEVLPGAFTLWNQQSNPTTIITADLTGLSAGRANHPVLGSGIFVSGAGDIGGKLIVSRLETNAVYSNGKIKAGTPGLISGGVFTVYGAVVSKVHNYGPVMTYGPNDMVLDNWGVVDSWIAEEKITSFGPSGIGFVNFGDINELIINAPIETFGQGARGFNVYTGTVHSAEFDRIITYADGAVGIQISQPIGQLVVHRGIVTYGETGSSLVKGVVVELAAIALSIKPGGSAQQITVSGGIVTHGKGIPPLEMHGSVDLFLINDGCKSVN